MVNRVPTAILVTLALCACDSATGPKQQQNDSDFPIQATAQWDWASSVATDGNGYLVATWRGDSTIVNVYPTATLGTVSVVQLSSTGTPVGSPVDLAQTPGDAAGIYYDGTNYVVEYTNGPQTSSTVNVQFINHSGSRVGNPITLGGGYLAQDMSYGAGSYLFTYTALGVNSNIGAARVLFSNGTLGPEIIVAPEPGGASGVAFDGSNFAVMYTRGGTAKGVGVKFISPTGQLVRDVPIATTAGAFTRATVAFNGSTYLAAWDESGQSANLHVQAFRPDGSLIGQPSTISGSTTLRMGSLWANGSNFVAEYVDRTGGLPYSTKVQEFSATGSPIGSAVDITFSDGSRPRVVTLTQAASGQRVLAVMTSDKGRTWDVYGRFIPLP